MITKRLQDIFNIHPGEERMAALILGYAILLFSSNVFTLTASLGLFFGTYDAATLPYTYVLLMFFGPLVSLIVLRLNNQFTLAKALLGVHIFLLLSLILLPFVLSRSDVPVLRFALPIYLEVYVTLTYASFWNLLGRIYNLRQGKRLFPILSSGEHLATIGASLIATFFIARIGTVNLYWASALCMTGATALLVAISRASADKMETRALDGREKTGVAASLSILVKEPYILLVFVTVALYTISAFLIENLSFVEAEMRFTTADSMARYLSVFMGIYGALGLLVQWVIAARALDRFGASAVMLSLPGGLCIFMTLFALVGSLNNSAVALFWLASGANMYAYTLFAPYVTARNVMLQPLPAHLRTQAQTIALGFAYPLATGFSGLLLLFLNNVLGFQSVQISYAILVILLLWLLAVLRLGQMYGHRLRQTLEARILTKSGFLHAADRTSIPVLAEALGSTHPAVVLYALNTLAEIAPEMLPERLPDLLGHPDDQVRLAALRHTATVPWRETPPHLERLLNSDARPEVRAAALRTWYDISPRLASPTLVVLSQDPQALVRQTALAIMRGHDDPDLRLQANKTFSDLVDSMKSSDRILAATIIGETGIMGVKTPGEEALLISLLADREPRVVQAALAAAAHARLPATWPKIVPFLAEKDTMPTAVTALVAAGEDVLPLLQAVRQEPDQDPRILLGVALVCSRIAGPEAAVILETLLDHPDSDVRRQAILGLAQSTYQAAQQKRGTIQQAIHAQAQELAAIVAAQVDLGATREVLLAANSLEQRRRLGTDNLLLLLSFLYEPETVLSARNALQVSRFEEEKHAYAVELLDILLDHADKSLLLPLLHRLSPQQRLAKLQKQFPQAMLGRVGRLRWLLGHSKVGNARWTKSCAVYALGLLEDVEAAEAIIATGIDGSDDPLLVETVLNSLEQLDVPLENFAATPALETAVALWRARERQAMTLLQKAESLKQASIFANLPDDALEAIAGLASVVTIKAQETLIHKNDPGDSMYVVVDGQLQVNENSHIFDALNPGDIVGEMALLGTGQRSASVTAVTNCRLLRLDQKPFYDLLANQPEMARELLRLLSRRLRDRTADLIPQMQRGSAHAMLPVVVGQPGIGGSAVPPEALINLDRLFILKSIDFFDGINDTLVAQVAALLEEVDLAGGELLFRQGDPGHSLFIVAVGQVRIHIGERTLAYAGEGEVIGEMALLESEPRLASVTAVVPTRLLRLDQQLFFELLEVQPDMTRGIIKTLSGRQRDRLRELVPQMG